MADRNTNPDSSLGELSEETLDLITDIIESDARERNPSTVRHHLATSPFASLSADAVPLDDTDRPFDPGSSPNYGPSRLGLYSSEIQNRFVFLETSSADVRSRLFDTSPTFPDDVYLGSGAVGQFDAGRRTPHDPLSPEQYLVARQDTLSPLQFLVARHDPLSPEQYLVAGHDTLSPQQYLVAGQGTLSSEQYLVARQDTLSPEQYLVAAGHDTPSPQQYLVAGQGSLSSEQYLVARQDTISPEQYLVSPEQYLVSRELSIPDSFIFQDIPNQRPLCVSTLSSPPTFDSSCRPRPTQLTNTYTDPTWSIAVLQSGPPLVNPGTILGSIFITGGTFTARPKTSGAFSPVAPLSLESGDVPVLGQFTFNQDPQISQESSSESLVFSADDDGSSRRFRVRSKSEMCLSTNTGGVSSPSLGGNGGNSGGGGDQGPSPLKKQRRCQSQRPASTSSYHDTATGSVCI